MRRQNSQGPHSGKGGQAMTFGSAGRSKVLVLLAASALLLASFGVVALQAATAKEIDAKVDAALGRFHAEVKGAKELLQGAKGVCVFAGVVKAGLGIGGEYGEGALRIGDKTADYYSIASASIGLQFGAQKKDVIIVFMEGQALKKFQESSGWKAGVDGSVALIDIGAGKSVDTTNIKDPIVGFIVGQKGLMYNLTLEGSKISKLNKSK
jgi:lipid-binding SYLF domain-containing protein